MIPKAVNTALLAEVENLENLILSELRTSIKNQMRLDVESNLPYHSITFVSSAENITSLRTWEEKGLVIL